MHKTIVHHTLINFEERQTEVLFSYLYQIASPLLSFPVLQEYPNPCTSPLSLFLLHIFRKFSALFLHLFSSGFSASLTSLLGLCCPMKPSKQLYQLNINPHRFTWVCTETRIRVLIENQQAQYNQCIRCVVL